MGLHLEVCPTSNVHTGASASLATHPITPLWRAGLSLSFHTDNTLMSSITLAGEAHDLLQQTPLTLEDLVQMQLQAAAASFGPLELPAVTVDAGSFFPRIGRRRVLAAATMACRQCDWLARRSSRATGLNAASRRRP